MFLTVLFSCLLLVAPGLGEECGDHVMEMMKQMREERKEEVMVMRKELGEEMNVIKKDKFELEEKVGELTKKVAEMEEKSTRDLPYIMACAYQNDWKTPSSTITYDYLSANYNNAGRPGGGDGNMDITTGKFTALTPGHYTVTYSGYAVLNPGEMVDLYLYHNGESLGFESQWLSKADSNDASSTYEQGSRSLVSAWHHSSFLP